MVWLAKWIREHIVEPRRNHHGPQGLDEQIENVFKGVSEDIHRTKGGSDLIEALHTVTLVDLFADP